MFWCRQLFRQFLENSRFEKLILVCEFFWALWLVAWWVAWWKEELELNHDPL